MPSQAYVAMRCAKTGGHLVGRFDKAGLRWDLVTATVVSAGAGPPAGAGTNVSGVFGIAETYRGCPSCGNLSYTRCGACGMLTCWSGQGESSCGACGAGGPVEGAITDMNAGDLS